jgi:hypothetical protein
VIIAGFCPPLKCTAWLPLTERPLSTKANVLPLGLGPLLIQPIKLFQPAGCWPLMSSSKSSEKTTLPLLEVLELELDELLFVDDEELLTGDDEALLDITEELELITLLDDTVTLDEDDEWLLTRLDELFPPTMPQGLGCELHVLAAMQLRFCSHPQPLCVVVHSEYRVPYQLHCWPEITLDWLLDDIALDDELEIVAELLDKDTLLERDEDEMLLADEVVPLHGLPLIVGISAAPPFLLTWKPNSTRCPGWILLFHPNADAV